LRKQRQQEESRAPAPPVTPATAEPNLPGQLPTSETSTTVNSRSIIEWAFVALPPTTLVTALAFWFGYALTASRNSYLGIDVSTLGFSATDYLLRSIDALIIPAISLLAIWLLLLGFHAWVWPKILEQRTKKLVRRGLIALTLSGLMATGFSIRFAFDRLPPEAYLVPPLLLGSGSVCVAYGIKGLRAIRERCDSPSQDSHSPAQPDRMQAILTALLIISLFWGATLHAGALGRGRAIGFVDNLSTRPSVTVYSKTSLALPPPVVETPIEAPNSEYRFRYTQLRLVIRSDDKYFLLPEGWTHSTGTAILLEDTPTIRLEFRPGGP
jgi:hypothetical protein